MRLLTETLQAPAINNYGMTETGMITSCGRLLDDVLSWRLEDVPELGYFKTDRPYPRGELLLKTRVMIPGYFRRPEV